MENYCGVSLYDIDIENIYTIDNEDIHFVRKYDYALIGNPENPDGTSSYHEYFLVCYAFFDRILKTDQNPDIVLIIISQDV